MNRTFWAILALLGSLVTAQAATLLPNGKQTFIDQNGAPLAAGTVTMYVPGTTTAKQTWKDAAQTILNTNPLTLDISGQAVIYGTGCYRQIVKDKNGNTIWDQPTCDLSSTSLIWAGHSSGTANNQTLTATNFSNQDGQTIGFIAGQTNTGALGLVINGGSPVNVLRDTANGPFSLAGGEVFAGNNILVQYDAARGAFHLVANPATGSTPFVSLSGSGTTDLGSASSHYINITGTATISSFGSSASLSFPTYTLVFNAASTLVNSGSIALPGGANITTATGDVAVAAYSGAGVWRVLTYAKANGGTLVQTPVSQFVTACPWTVLATSGGILPTRVDFWEVGGGGGGGGNGNDGGAGGTTSFNGITAAGGVGGVHSVNAFGVDGGAGGTGGAGASTLRLAGQSGFGSPATEGGAGVGASVGLGGAGGRSPATGSVGGAPSPANTSARQAGGIGGGGAGYTGTSTSIAASSGGGGGEYVDSFVLNPGATIACTLGAGGTAGTSAGAGGVGAIMTRSYWQ